MSEIFVVGSAGFIGSNVTNYLIQHSNYEIASVDNLKNKNLDRLAPAVQSRNRHTFYLVDLENKVLLEKAFSIEKPHTLIYCAFDTSKTAIENMAMIESVVKRSQPQKVIFTASVSDNEVFWSEMEKLLIDILKSIPWMSIIKWIFLKVENLFGPRQSLSSDSDAALSGLLKKVLWDNSYAGGSYDKVYDWVYVKDYFAQVHKFIEEDFVSGEYSVVSGNTASIGSVADFINGLVFEQKRKTIPLGAVVLDGSPTNKIFIPPSKTFEDAVEHTTAWYAANRWMGAA